MDIVLPTKKEQQNNISHPKLKYREDDGYRRHFNSSNHVYKPVER